MSKYKQVDDVINKWVKKNNLHLFKTCKDEEIRAIRLTDSKGRIYGLGIDSPKENEITVRFYAWDYKKRNKSITVNVEQLMTILDKSLQTIYTWMSS